MHVSAKLIETKLSLNLYHANLATRSAARIVIEINGHPLSKYVCVCMHPCECVCVFIADKTTWRRTGKLVVLLLHEMMNKGCQEAMHETV